MRYTEIRLSKIAHEMLADIDKDTVDYAPNYDGSEKEPTVLPARLPNCWSTLAGIAVAWPQHPAAQPERDRRRLPAPAEERRRDDRRADGDRAGARLPTAGIIYGLNGVREGYRTGAAR